MQTLSSAKRTWRAFLSADEWTETVRMPSSRHARMIRSAISPRLAMRPLLNMELPRGQLEQRLAVLHRLRILLQDRDHGAVGVGLDLVHELHRLDDARRLLLLHLLADLHERGGLG